MPIRVVAFLAGTLPTLSVSLSPQYNSTRSTLNFLCPPSGTATSTPLSTSTTSGSTLNAFMATPSSSATSPSPPMAYLAPGPGSLQPDSPASDTLEREQRKKAVQKFLARAEISMVTRALRARLSYASYKATHNIPHVPLRDLETQGQSQTASFNRTIAAKRKAVGGANTSTYHQSPATQASNTPGPGTARRGGSGSMAPPAAVSSPRTHHPSAVHAHSYSVSDISASLRKPGQAPNLFSAILAPPPARQARTVHNPNDPPVPAPSRPAPSPRARPSRTSPRNDPARPQSKQKPAKNAKPPASPNRRRGKTASVDKGKQKQIAADSMDVDGDVDMKAAATLTSLLMHHHRPSIAGSASSPRSSIDGSEPGSVYSYSHFAQSSARTAAPSSLAPTATLVERIHTPPPPAGGGGTPRQQTTPRAAPTDNEAANLMLFLATSPSPARAATKDSKDLAAYRALGGGTGPLRTKGRVLFPSSSAPDHPHGHEDLSAGTHKMAPALARGGESSFTSSISSIGAELGGALRSQSKDGHVYHLSSSGVNTTSSTIMDVDSTSRLLPPAPLPLPSAPASPAANKEATASPRLKPTATATTTTAGGNAAGTPDFNIHEFINASPSSPSRAQAAHAHRSNLGLRADVGRKLFEEEQLRHAQALQAAAAATSVPGSGPRQDERGLGAGIDLVQT